MSSESEKKYSLSDDLSIQDIERLYFDEILTQDFYDDSYGKDWNLDPYVEMAGLLKELINPETHLDIGCGLGFLVKAMRGKGVASIGVDFSEAIIARAGMDVKSHLKVASTENWLKTASIKGVELITYMEVFEHLPVSIIKGILKGISVDIGDNILFLTIPSYGIDNILKSGIVTNESTPEWQRDMEKNVPFQNIVLENGQPHFGHITLASYRWWTDFFLAMGFVRHRDLEMKCYESSKDLLSKYNWNPYILTTKNNVNENFVEYGVGLASGWYDFEKEMGGRWTNGCAHFYWFDKKPDSISLTLSFPSINIIEDFSILLVVEQLVEKEGSRFCWHMCASPAMFTVASRIACQDFLVKLRGNSLTMSEGVLHNVWRLKLISPQWCPDEFYLSPDYRNLGVFVHNIQL